MYAVTHKHIQPSPPHFHINVIASNTDITFEDIVLIICPRHRDHLFQ